MIGTVTCPAMIGRQDRARAAWEWRCQKVEWEVPVGDCPVSPRLAGAFAVRCCRRGEDTVSRQCWNMHVSG